MKYVAVCLMILLFGMSVSPVTGEKTCTFSRPRLLEVGEGKPYSSIQAAINDAEAGDWIIVYEGEYHEGIFINKDNIFLVGKDRDRVIINATGKAYGIKVDASRITIRGFTITRASGDGIFIRTLSEEKQIRYIDIENCNIVKNEKNGIFIESILPTRKPPFPYIEGIKIQSCKITDNGEDGIHASYSDIESITLCDISDNGEDGIEIGYCTTVVIMDNRVSWNDGKGIYIYVPEEGLEYPTGVYFIERNDIRGNGYEGIRLAGYIMAAFIESNNLIGNSKEKERKQVSGSVSYRFMKCKLPPIIFLWKNYWNPYKMEIVVGGLKVPMYNKDRKRATKEYDIEVEDP